ncbi:MAG: FkbM family methyltransferase [Methylacidiphilaceae bacterium]|nr:FkbM family methyltransferase [Candidatus Methylacidiphilaceae bacterium]
MALQRALRPGMCYWDVGANVGFYSLLGSRLAGPEGRVVAIEPDPENAKRLRAAVERNGLRNIEVVEAALGSWDGVVALERCGARSRLLAAREETTGGDTVSVTVRTAEGLAGRFGAPDVVKVDVEGAEVEVLRGFGSLLRERKPVFLVEFHGEELLEEARKLLPDYSFCRIDRDHWRLEPAGSP